MLQSEKHIANGKEYEIRIVPTKNGFQVRTYFQGKQIGWTFSATHDVADMFNMTTAQIAGLPAAAELINIAKDDLDHGITK